MPRLENSLSLSDCQQLALEKNPSLQPWEYELEAQDGQVEQMGLSPNPELEFEAEDIFGTGDLQGIKHAEGTLGLSQTIETAGKRKKRIFTAEREKDVVREELNLARLNVLYQTTDAFIDVLTWQERLELEETFYEISQEILDTIGTRVEAGRDSPMEETRAKVMVSSSRIRLDRAKKTLQKKKIALSSQWKSEQPTFEIVEGDLLSLSTPSEIELVSPPLNHPVLAQSRNEIQRREAVLGLEHAKATPDFTVGAGIRYANEVDDSSLVFGFSVPLPFRDRNQGAIRAAQARITKAEKEYEQKSFELNFKLHQNYQDYLQNYEETKILQEDILPEAQRAFEAAQEGFRQGKFSYLNVLDAQRSLFELKVQLLEAASNVHKTINEINRLMMNYKILEEQKKEISQ